MRRRQDHQDAFFRARQLDVAWQGTSVAAKWHAWSLPSSWARTSLFQKASAWRRSHGRQTVRYYRHQVLVSHGCPTSSDVLQPSSHHLSNSFVAFLGQSKEDLSKCQLLTVSRDAYRTLAEDRIRVNPGVSPHVHGPRDGGRSSREWWAATVSRMRSSLCQR